MSLTQNFNSLFAPMDEKYCELFYGISIFYFLIMILAVFNFVFLFKDIKRNKYLMINSIVVVLILGINYIYNRLLFNMCKK
jgi:hypothetical protein